MINRNTMLIENHHFLLEFKSNKRRYMDFLKTMAKYHKYSVPQQMNLFFHAPAAATAVAPLEVWEKLGHPIKEGARAIPILTGERNRETASFVYDMRDASGYQEGQTVLWKLDVEKEEEYLSQSFPGKEGEELPERILSKCRGMAKLSQVEHPDLVALSAAYVVLTRMGFDAEKALGTDFISFPEQAIPMEEMLAAVN